MKRVIVDMDGVMADVYHQLVQFEKRDSGREIEISNLVGIPEIEAFPNGKKHVNEVGFFRTLPVMEGSRAALEYINNKYELYIVSAGMEFPNSLREKFDWLGEHFPFISWEQIVLCGSKKVIHGDVMIDDYPKNLDHFYPTPQRADRKRTLQESVFMGRDHGYSVRKKDYTFFRTSITKW